MEQNIKFSFCVLFDLSSSLLFFFLKNTGKYEYNINIVAYDGSPYKTKYFQITVHATRKLQEFKIIICKLKEIMSAFVHAYPKD